MLVKGEDLGCPSFPSSSRDMNQVKSEPGEALNKGPVAEEIPESFNFEYPAILTIIKLANAQDSLLHPSFIDARSRYSEGYTHGLAVQYQRLIHATATEDTCRSLRSYMETYFDPNERTDFSLLGRRYLMWHFNLHEVIHRITRFASAEYLRRPHSALVLAHVINVHLAEAPVFFFDPPLKSLKSFILASLENITKQRIVLSHMEKLALRVSVAQIIARAARLQWSNLELYGIAGLVGSEHISMDDVNDIVLSVNQNLQSDLQNNPDLMIGGSYSVIDAQQTGIDKGYSSLMQCALMYPVLYTIPLLKEVHDDFSPANIEEYIYLEHTIDHYFLKMSSTEWIFAVNKWETRQQHLEETNSVDALSPNIDLLVNTLESKIVPIPVVVDGSSIRDPRRILSGTDVARTEVGKSSLESKILPTQLNRSALDSSSRDPRRIRSRTDSSNTEGSSQKKSKLSTLEDRMDQAIKDAMDGGDINRILGLLDSGVSANFTRYEDRETIMMAAAASAPLDVIRTLFTRGCSVMAKDRLGRDPLIIAKEKRRSVDICTLIRQLKHEERTRTKAASSTG